MADTIDKQSATRGPKKKAARGLAGSLTRPSRDDRAAAGKAARAVAPLDSHAALDVPASRDPVALLEEQALTRVPELVPVRYGRMLVSPFTYYRGAALPMAADLATTPTSGLRVQLCGDAHLSNFGGFASPERALVFDVNDFDETLPGPFEWDIKRLAASLVVAARDNEFTSKESQAIARASVRAYREMMRTLAQETMMEVWYSSVDVEQALTSIKADIGPKRFKATEAYVAKARSRDSTQALKKLTTVVNGRRQIISQPPLIVPVEELLPELGANAIYQVIGELISGYTATLQSDRRYLVRQFELVQLARKVVGVGSVGTRAWIVLMDGGDGVEPLFLQAKEAQQSVLANFAGASEYSNQGQRVVAGQHLMQAVSDIFLGWQSVAGVDGVERDYYIRQLRDWKISLPIEQMLPAGMRHYGELCGATLARAHARSGDRIAVAAYLGKTTQFDDAVAAFAESYADLNQRDHAALAAAAAEGRVTAELDL